MTTRPLLGVLMRPFPLSSCSVRFTWTVERPVASASSARDRQLVSLPVHSAAAMLTAAGMKPYAAAPVGYSKCSDLGRPTTAARGRAAPARADPSRSSGLSVEHKAPDRHALM